MNESDADFLDWVASYETWYKREAQTYVAILKICRVFSFIGSIVSLVLAAAASKDFILASGKWLIVAANILSVFAAEWMSRFQVRQMEELRERGHIEATDLHRYARDKLSEHAGQPEMLSRLKDDLREKIKALEYAQHRGFVGITGGVRQKPETEKQNIGVKLP
jgi:hypothetical protein